MRLPTTKPTPAFQVGDYVAFEPLLVSTEGKEAGYMKLVFQIVSFDGSTLKYRAVNKVGENAAEMYLAGSFFRPLSDADLLRFRLTGSL